MESDLTRPGPSSTATLNTRCAFVCSTVCFLCFSLCLFLRLSRPTCACDWHGLFVVKCQQTGQSTVSRMCRRNYELHTTLPLTSRRPGESLTTAWWKPTPRLDILEACRVQYKLQQCQNVITENLLRETSSSAIAERPRCMVG